VAVALDHTRDSTLNRAGFFAGRLLESGLVDEGDVTEALTEAALATGLPAGQIRSTLTSALASGRRSGPFDGRR
jgi:hypothetical protein